MKKIIVFLSLTLAILTGCKNNGKKQAENKDTVSQELTVDTQDTHTTADTVDTGYTGEEYKVTVSDYDYTAPYICPNHCPGSGSDKPGKCPVCGMDLIPNPDYQK